MNETEPTMYPSSHPSKFTFNYDTDDKPLQASSSFIGLHIALIGVTSLSLLIILIFIAIYGKEENVIRKVYDLFQNLIKRRNRYKSMSNQVNDAKGATDGPLYHDFFGKNSNDDLAKVDWLFDWRQQKQRSNTRINSVISSVLHNDSNEVSCQQESSGNQHHHHHHHHHHYKGVVVVPPAMMRNLCKHSVSRGQFLSQTDQEFVKRIEEDNEIMSPKRRQRDMSEVFAV